MALHPVACDGSSGYRNTKSLSFDLLEKGQGPATYTVSLYFAEPEELEVAQRVFDVLVQGETVLKDFDIVKQAGGVRTGLVKEFKGIVVEDKLVMTLRVVDSSSTKEPILCGFEAVRE